MYKTALILVLLAGAPGYVQAEEAARAYAGEVDGVTSSLSYFGSETPVRAVLSLKSESCDAEVTVLGEMVDDHRFEGRADTGPQCLVQIDFNENQHALVREDGCFDAGETSCAFSGELAPQ